MNFIEIDNNKTINLDQVLMYVLNKYTDKCEIDLCDNKHVVCDSIYYYKINDIVKPTRLSKSLEPSVNDFPGDNMIEE